MALAPLPHMALSRLRWGASEAARPGSKRDLEGHTPPAQRASSEPLHPLQSLNDPVPTARFCYRTRPLRGSYREEDPMSALILDANPLSWPHDDESEARSAKCRACPERADPRPSVAGRSSVLSVASRRGPAAAVGTGTRFTKRAKKRRRSQSGPVGSVKNLGRTIGVS
jgi:hypothetical protein